MTKWRKSQQRDGQTDRRTERRMDGWTDGRTDKRTDKQTDGWTDGRTDGRTDGQTDRQMDGQTLIQSCLFATKEHKTDKRIRIRLEKLWTNQRSATREPVVAVRERILYEARVPGDGTMLI